MVFLYTCTFRQSWLSFDCLEFACWNFLQVMILQVHYWKKKRLAKAKKREKYCFFQWICTCKNAVALTEWSILFYRIWKSGSRWKFYRLNWEKWCNYCLGMRISWLETVWKSKWQKIRHKNRDQRCKRHHFQDLQTQ